MLIGQCIIGKVREFPYANDLTNRLDNRLSQLFTSVCLYVPEQELTVYFRLSVCPPAGVNCLLPSVCMSPSRSYILFTSVCLYVPQQELTVYFRLSVCPQQELYTVYFRLSVRPPAGVNCLLPSVCMSPSRS